MRSQLLIAALFLFASAIAVSAPEPQRIYSPNPADPWNQIFTSLFSRTFQARLSDEFPEASPVRILERAAGRSPEVRISERVFDRFENGDHAIDPLYPSFIASAGPLEALSDPLYSELTGAIGAALTETRARPPLARALTQSDAWAAYDILFNARGTDGPAKREHRDALLSLLRQFLKKLALSPDEIRGLPSNYSALVRSSHAPDGSQSEQRMDRSPVDSRSFARGRSTVPACGTRLS